MAKLTSKPPEKLFLNDITVNDANFRINNRTSTSIVEDNIPDKFINFNPVRKALGDPALNGYAFIFFSKPDLNLNHDSYKTTMVKNKKNAKDKKKNKIPIYKYIQHLKNSTKNDKEILQSLTHSKIEGASGVNSRFINLLANSFTSFSPQDTSIKTKEIETFSGNKVVMPTTLSDSISGQLSIEFEESQDMYITKMHKVWVEYMDMIRKGYLEPKREYTNNKGFRKLDYTSSIYYFRTLPDAETITFWAKYTGCFPTSIPYSSLNFNEGSIDAVKLGFNYAFSFKEELDPEIIDDFNMLSTSDFSEKTSNDVMIQKVKAKLNKNGDLEVKLKNDDAYSPTVKGINGIIKMAKSRDKYFHKPAKDVKGVKITKNEEGKYKLKFF